jgi:tRNA-dihydrouridine synthase B
VPEIIDINMGCPAKKVCGAQAGAALLRDETLVGRILEAVVGAVAVPVTLKIRTGWDLTHRNGIAVARIAEQAGIQALAVHGRTRACGYSGPVDYAAIRAIKQAVTIPVIANGDIDSPEQARRVLDYTGADAVMIGRGAQGRPWIFREIAHFLASGERLAPPSPLQIGRWVTAHLTTTVRVLRRNRRCSHRPQTFDLVQPALARERGVPSEGERGRKRPRPTAAGPRFFRAPGQ